MSLIGIAGPLATGKSTLFSLLESKLGSKAVFLHDINDVVYEDIMTAGKFGSFKEVSKDRDYLLIYYGKLIEKYKIRVKAYQHDPRLIFFDGTHIDLLIYGMLSLWYHYPSKGVQEKMVHELLEFKRALSLVYMTIPDDDNYPLTSLGERRYVTSFRKNRKTEIEYYDIFRDLPYVVSLPSASVLECDTFIIEDIRDRGYLQ